MNDGVQERSARGRRLILAGVAINVLLAAAKFVGGFLGGSKALLADGLESTLDILSSGMMWAALKMAARPADETHPYGHGKVESLGAVAGALLLLLAGAGLAAQSLAAIWRLNTGGSGVPPEPFTLGILIAEIICKESLFRISSSTAQGIQSSALKADAWHHRSDALTSLAALATRQRR
ncbi:MAG: cation diffusion facilitator family transporter [Terrimicrobiaceae bacterium]|nr:cation diffusion facilitator family transporter [Terrimicrobiaceae bacterium]